MAAVDAAVDALAVVEEHAASAGQRGGVAAQGCSCTIQCLASVTIHAKRGRLFDTF